MNSTFIPIPSKEIEHNVDLLVLTCSIAQAEDVDFVFSYTLTGKQILENLQKRLQLIQIKNVCFHANLTDGIVTISELNKSAGLFDIIESPQDHFAAVVLCLSPDLKGTNELLPQMCAAYLSTYILFSQLNHCAISNIYLSKYDTQPQTDGFYLENEDLTNIFKRSTVLKAPYDTLLSSGEYAIPDWYKKLENQKPSSHIYTPSGCKPRNIFGPPCPNR